MYAGIHLPVLGETIVVGFSAPGTVAPVHQLAQMLEPTETMQVCRARV